MGGVAIFLFSKTKLLNRIKQLYMSKVAVGTSGYAQNKGCVALRFQIDRTSFAFINCHLEAGEGQVVKRVEMLQTILEESFRQTKIEAG